MDNIVYMLISELMSGEHKETDYEAPITKKRGGRKNKGGGS